MKYQACSLSAYRMSGRGRRAVVPLVVLVIFVVFRVPAHEAAAGLPAAQHERQRQQQQGQNDAPPAPGFFVLAHVPCSSPAQTTRPEAKKLLVAL
jgi:hypothetical protein